VSRIQLALNVDDLDASIKYYSSLFGTSPAKTKPGYANFAVGEPPLKLVLIENTGLGGSINHLGVEVTDTSAVGATKSRLTEEGLASTEERDSTCCYARQDKFWVEGGPDGERWEVYTVLADSETFSAADAGETCCATEAASSSEAAVCC
jgi:catechol 2,3-dioxygenase-like lactoylglutathione lyase family enzyme